MLPKASVTIMLGDDLIFALTDDNRVSAPVEADRRSIVAIALGRAAIALAQMMEQPNEIALIRHDMATLDGIGTPEALALREDLDARLGDLMGFARRAAALIAGGSPSPLN